MNFKLVQHKIIISIVCVLYLRVCECVAGGCMLVCVNN